MYIDDPDEVKPADWDEQVMIPDSTVKKPADWDDKLEGFWEPPMIKNPNYKGPWTRHKILNKKYKGIWKAGRIPNPKYKEELPQDYTIGGVGIDVWQVKPGTIFDNIMLTDSIDDALAQAETIIEKQVEFEKEQKSREEGKPIEKPKPKKAESQEEEPHVEEAKKDL